MTSPTTFRAQHRAERDDIYQTCWLCGGEGTILATVAWSDEPEERECSECEGQGRIYMGEDDGTSDL